MSERTRVGTGIKQLDRKLEGGLPTRSIVTLSVDAMSQSDVLLSTIASSSSGGPTLHITTKKGKEILKDQYEQVDLEPPTIQTAFEEEMHDIEEMTRQVPEKSLVIIDTVNTIERKESTRSYTRFLNNIKRVANNTNSIVILYLTKGQESDNRDTTYTMSDLILDVDTSTEGSELTNILSIPKFIGGYPLEDAIKLEITDRVTVDTSREIS